MTNLSLARIMYGTTEDSHASTNTTVSTLSMRSSHSTDGSPRKLADEPETLAELLHRVWTNISGKH